MSTSGLARFLVHEGLLSENDCQMIARDHSNTGAAFAKVVVAMGLMNEETLARFIAEKTQLPHLPPRRPCESTPEAVASLSPPLMRSLEVVPLSLNGNVLTVAMADPLDHDTLQQLAFFTPYKVKAVVAPFSALYLSLGRLLTNFKPQRTALEQLLGQYSGPPRREAASAGPQPSQVPPRTRAVTTGRPASASSSMPSPAANAPPAVAGVNAQQQAAQDPDFPMDPKEQQMMADLNLDKFDQGEDLPAIDEGTLLGDEGAVAAADPASLGEDGMDLLDENAVFSDASLAEDLDALAGSGAAPKNNKAPAANAAADDMGLWPDDEATPQELSLEADQALAPSEQSEGHSELTSDDDALLADAESLVADEEQRGLGALPSDPMVEEGMEIAAANEAQPLGDLVGEGDDELNVLTIEEAASDSGEALDTELDLSDDALEQGLGALGPAEDEFSGKLDAAAVPGLSAEDDQELATLMAGDRNAGMDGGEESDLLDLTPDQAGALGPSEDEFEVGTDELEIESQSASKSALGTGEDEFDALAAEASEDLAGLAASGGALGGGEDEFDALAAEVSEDTADVAASEGALGGGEDEFDGLNAEMSAANAAAAMADDELAATADDWEGLVVPGEGEAPASAGGLLSKPTQSKTTKASTAASQRQPSVLEAAALQSELDEDELDLSLEPSVSAADRSLVESALSGHEAELAPVLQTQAAVASLNHALAATALAFDLKKAQSSAQAGLQKAGMPQGILYWGQADSCTLLTAWRVDGADGNDLAAHFPVAMARKLASESPSQQWLTIPPSTPKLTQLVQGQQHGLMYKGADEGEGYAFALVACRAEAAADSAILTGAGQLLSRLAKKLNRGGGELS